MKKHPTQSDINSFKFKDTEFRSPQATKKVWFLMCVSVAIRKDVVAVRNSNDLDKKTIVFTPEEWRVFIDAVKKGEFDITD